MFRSISLQTNAMFHIPAFLNPLENGIRNRLTCYFLKDFSRKNIVWFQHIPVIIISAERVLRSVSEYKPILYVGSVHQVKAVSRCVRMDFT